jgi:hypothetical protein
MLFKKYTQTKKFSLNGDMKENILDIYKNYKIMPTLQEHQFRVAAVSKQICDSFTIPLNTNGVVNVCLFHDMGNIIKFDLNYFPDFLQPEGLEYWQKVKDEYVEKYGTDEHEATEKICEEIGLTDAELDYLHAIGFSRIKNVLADSSLEQKICLYSDLRVGPYGILSIEDRLIDGRKRYEYRKDRAMGIEAFEEFANALRDLEKQLFSFLPIKPEDINNMTIESIVSSLKKI